MFKIKELLFNAEPSALGGAAVPPVEPVAGVPPVEPTPSIWDGQKANLPEGLDADVKESTFLKPFVDKESGEVNYSNLMKSYVHAQNNVNSAKVVLPGENSTAQELDEFHAKLGYVTDENDYVVNKSEESNLSDERVAEIKAFARENRLPLSTANKLVAHLEKSGTDSNAAMAEANNTQIAEGLNGLKTEWGQAYGQKLASAQRVLNEVVKDEAILAVFADPSIGSNPAVIKALSMIGEGLFKEDGIQGNSQTNAFSPAEATTQINEIMADMAGPYWNKGHPSHNDMVAKVNKLHEMKRGV